MTLSVLAASTIPGWMQGVAAILTALLTLLTLIVLLRYADDTKRIADVSASQTEHSQMPFLAVIKRSDGWAIRNQGFGPAVNIVFTGYNPGANESTKKPTLPLGIGEDKVLPELEQVLGNWRQITVWYESLSGREYITTFKRLESGDHTQFQKNHPAIPDLTIKDSLTGFASFLKFWR